MSLREIALLLETGGEEFKKGNSSRGLSILFEAQSLLSEVVQRQAEMMQGPALLEPPLGVTGPISKLIH
jgi:hypothetical protein